jgi:acetolactate synthase-1/2/3 large subunit
VKGVCILGNEQNLNGADHLVFALKNAGVKIIFCISGAGNLAIIDAIVRDNSIQLIYSHHEQAAVIEAQGYSRISGNIGVAIVTTGGGTSNVATGALSAYLDSVPVLIISGNESSFHCLNSNKLRAYGVQGFDSVSFLKPIVKSTRRVLRSEEVISITEEMIAIALESRMGPVHIDFPMDLQRKNVSNENSQNILPTEPYSENKNYDYNFSIQLVDHLVKSQKPVMYIGNGCRSEPTLKLLEKIINKLQIPFFVSWSAIDLFPEDNPLNMGRIGIYGDRAANIALQKADLLLCLGTRLAIPQIGYDSNDFARNATKWIVEIDETECIKFDNLKYQVLKTDVLYFLQDLDILINTANINISKDWLKDLENIWGELPRYDQTGQNALKNKEYLHSADVIQVLNTKLKSDAIIVTDVGAGLLTGHYMYEAKGTQRFFTSQGLGEMGFGLPGAIGAHFAAPKKQIVCLNTDGGIMFNLQEMQLIPEHQIPLKLFIFNNNGYTMIKTSQQNLFGARFSGSSKETGISFPSFEKLADLFNFQYYRATNSNFNNDLFNEMLDSAKPVLFEIIMDPEQKYLPRLSTGKLSDGTLVSPPLEDLDPLISVELLQKLLGQKLHPNSLKSREK